MNQNSDISVQHNTAQHRFSVNIEGAEAVLDYRLFNPHPDTGKPTKIDFSSTWVPTQFRGKGFAEKLVREGLKWARAEGLEIHASCWYVAKFLRVTEKQ